MHTRHHATLLMGGAALATLPVAAFADIGNAGTVMNPTGLNAWTYYVAGNGDAISQILTSIKLVAGSNFFRLLMLATALLGIFALVIRGGFGGRGFAATGGYFLLIVGVIYGVEGSSVNIQVEDELSGYSNVITGVPALVGIPAAAFSLVGHEAVQVVEQNFSTPSNLKMSNGASYNMFGKVMDDLHHFVITDPDLKRSLSAYVSDCGVPAMALGKMPASALLNSNNLLKTLSQASSQALMTRYYPLNAAEANGSGASNTSLTDSSGNTIANSSCSSGFAAAGVTSNGMGGTSLNYSSDTGALMTCSQAYSCLTADLQTYAQGMSTATAQQWTQTGVMVPFEGAVTSALEQVGATGGNANVNWDTTPNGVILQETLVNSMSGAFRAAAARTGNNDMMMAASVSQAEQSQKTTWAVAGTVAQNMSGYVYVVLQAFIIAAVPIVILGALIPGFGGKIGGSFMKILAWLTLWPVLAAVVNFLMTVFGGSSLENDFTNGITLATSGVTDAATNNLAIAASFLGSLVPLLTWSLVQGTLAFTEVITHGIGNSFAASAGAQAATGNLSMGNISMDNVGTSKYNTSVSAAVGMQQVESYAGGGAAMTQFQDGGSSVSVSGSDATRSATAQDSWSYKSALGSQTNLSASQAAGVSAAMTKQASDAMATSKKYNDQLSALESAASSVKSDDVVGKQLVAKAGRALKRQISEDHSTDSSFSGGLSLSALTGGKAGGSGAGGEGRGGGDTGYGVRSSHGRSSSAQTDFSEALDRVNSHNRQVASGLSYQHAKDHNESVALSASADTSFSEAKSAASQFSKQASILESAASSATIEHSTTFGSSESVRGVAQGGSDFGGVGSDARAAVSSGGASVESSASGVADQVDALGVNRVGAEISRTGGGIDRSRSEVGHGVGGLADAVGSAQPGAGIDSSAASLQGQFHRGQTSSLTALGHVGVSISQEQSQIQFGASRFGHANPFGGPTAADVAERNEANSNDVPY